MCLQLHGGSQSQHSSGRAHQKGVPNGHTNLIEGSEGEELILHHPGSSALKGIACVDDGLGWRQLCQDGFERILHRLGLGVDQHLYGKVVRAVADEAFTCKPNNETYRYQSICSLCGTAVVSPGTSPSAACVEQLWFPQVPVHLQPVWNSCGFPRYQSICSLCRTAVVSPGTSPSTACVEQLWFPQVPVRLQPVWNSCGFPRYQSVYSLCRTAVLSPGTSPSTACVEHLCFS